MPPAKRSLLIVESPAKERTISNILGKSFIVKSCLGHVRDLPKRELGVDIQNGFTPKYVAIKAKKEVLAQLKKASQSASKIYLATDYDREGEAIAWHLVETLKPSPEKFVRITFHEITPRAIKEAIEAPRALDLNLINAQQARRIIDRLVGYSISPLLWRKLQKGLSAGRVQSVALGFIVLREQEIEAFKSQEYWTLHAELSEGPSPLRGSVGPGPQAQGAAASNAFLAQLVRRGDKKIGKLDLASGAQVDEIKKSLAGATYQVNDIKTSNLHRSPQAPFTTAGLQQASYRAFGFSPAQTMRFAQALYEGKELSEGHVGLITYMRTDSITIAKEAQAEAAQYIKEKFGDKYLVDEPNKRFKSKQKFIQEAHEAIRPTSAYRTPEQLKGILLPEELKLYTLIWVRLLASQMADQILGVTSVSIGALDCEFKATGSIIVFDGFRKAEMSVKELAGPIEEDLDKQILPPLSKGKTLACSKLIAGQHSTEPPPRYNSASLVKVLEANGVGRPSTYAPTIQTLLNRVYVRLEKKVFIPTDLGRKVYDRLAKHFASIVDIKFTANMEDLLDNVASGSAQWVKVLSDFWNVFEKDLKLAEVNMETQMIEPEVTKELCELCGSPMLLRESRFGKFLSCPKFPACKFKIGLTASGEKKVLIVTNIPCEKCGAPMVERTGRRGKFLACSKFPQCRSTKSVAKTPEPQDPPPQAAA